MIKYFRDKLKITSTNNKEDVSLNPYMEGDNTCMKWKHKVEDDYLYMHTCVLSHLGVDIPFTFVKVDFLISINITPSQLRHNSGSFVKGFMIVVGGIMVTSVDQTISNIRRGR